MVEEKEAAIETETETERNWTDLPLELLSLILKNRSDVSDFIRYRAVCKTWRLSCSISDLPPQFPWIVKISEGSNLEFYSIALKKLYTIRGRCSSGKSLLGSTGSYMLTKQYDKPDSYSLLNPISNTEVPLPLPHVCNLIWFPRMFTWYNPPNFQRGDYVFITEMERLVGCTPGDDRWNIIGPGHGTQYRRYYFKDLLFRVDSYNGFTKVMDISSQKELYDIPPPQYKKNYDNSLKGPYLVESSGEILSVSHNHSYEL
ncbi:F-box/kelch-repeat protein At1g57790-like [Carex rostrata]